MKDASEYKPVVRTVVGMNALVKDFNPPRDAEPSAGVLNLNEQEERLISEKS